MEMHCDIVTPEGTMFSGEAEMVVVPGKEGELGVLPRHAPIVAQLEVGETRVRTDATTWRRFATSDGYFMVEHHPVAEPGRALVLVEGAVAVEDIDAARRSRPWTTRRRGSRRPRAATRRSTATAPSATSRTPRTSSASSRAADTGTGGPRPPYRRTRGVSSR